MSIEIATPNKEANPAGYFTQALELFGIPILGSVQVDVEAFYAAAELVGNVIIHNDELRNALSFGVGSGVRVAIIDAEQLITDMPIFTDFADLKLADGRTYSDMRGLTWQSTSVAGEENLLDFADDIYHGSESVLLHEFAHSIHENFASIKADITEIYQHALSENLWQNTYAITDKKEYFAQLSQVWFDDKPDAAIADGTNHPVNTRAELKFYDEDAFDLLASIYRDDDWSVGDFLGSDGDDKIIGSVNSDLIFGREGDDFIIGGLGQNLLYGDEGHDKLTAFSGLNLLDGGVGNDYLSGGIMADELNGSAGNDVIRGEASSGSVGGSDVINGGAGDDLLMGGNGADVFMFKTNDGFDLIATFDAAQVGFNVENGYSAAVNGADFESGVDQIILDGFANLNADNLFDFIDDIDGNAAFAAQGTEITFYNVRENELSFGDFLLV